MLNVYTMVKQKKVIFVSFVILIFFFHDSRLYITVGNKMKQYFIINLFRTEGFTPLTKFLNKIKQIHFPTLHFFCFSSIFIWCLQIIYPPKFCVAFLFLT